jgi:hypothetical protein
MHEDFNREYGPSGPSDRSFGVTFAVFFAMVGLLPLFRRHSVRWWAIGISVAFLVVSIAAPQILHQGNRLWMGLARLLNRVMSPIIMGLVFYLAVLPTGLILRMLRKDPMRREFEPKAESYWIPRTPPGPPAESMSRQF